jgi:hypothetical protein
MTNPEVNKAAAAAATPMRTQRDLIDTTPPQSWSDPSKGKARQMPARKKGELAWKPENIRLQVIESA